MRNCGLKIVWKNVRKIRSRAKQMELMKWVETNAVDVCIICETGLNDDEYVEVCNGFKWIGNNRNREMGRSGGVGMIVKNSVHFKRRICVNDGIIAITLNGSQPILIGGMYVNCEGTRKEENLKLFEEVNGMIQESRDVGMNVIIGGDLNGHIFELDGCENENGKLIKKLVNTNSLEILNCVIPDMDKPMWSSNGNEYHLDYVLCNRDFVNQVLNG